MIDGDFETELAALLKKYRFDKDCGIVNVILAGFIHRILTGLVRVHLATTRTET